MRFHHILVTTDLSEEAERAFLPAAELARDHHARITLLHVVAVTKVAPHGAPLAPPIGPPDVDLQQERARTKATAQLELFPDGIPIGVDVITNQDVGEAVAHYVREHNVDLVALSTHGRTGLRRLVLGSVAEDILRHVPVPVLCFPPTGVADD